MDKDELKLKQEREEIKFYLDFWKHYITLEKLFMETEKFVAISKENKKAYSIQYDILLQAICAELDVVIKRLCKELDKNSEPNDMGDYIELLLSNYKEITKEKVKLELYNMEFIPWRGIGFRFEKGQRIPNCPKWWNGYNGVKHRRLTFEKCNDEIKIKERNIKQANQDNVLNALAGLFVVEKQCLNLMRNRFHKLLKQAGLEINIEITNRFNDSIFQEKIEVTECL